MKFVIQPNAVRTVKLGQVLNLSANAHEGHCFPGRPGRPDQSSCGRAGQSMFAEALALLEYSCSTSSSGLSLPQEASTYFRKSLSFADKLLKGKRS